VPTSVVADFQGTKNAGAGAGAGMMMHGDGKQKAAGAALFALTMAAAAAGGQNRNVQVNQPQVVRVRDRIELQRNIPVVAVREYAHKGKQMFILIDGGSGQVMNGERPAFALW